MRRDAGKTLILIPTYNERPNVEPLYRQIAALGLDTDLLFVDDNSPDGTGALLDELAAADPRVHVLHRPAKLGIGGAHLDGIDWAYRHGYQVLVSLDCDFSHNPADITRLLAELEENDVVVASRWMRSDSIAGWSWPRRLLTRLGHFCTRRLLGMPYDATGAFRVYNLANIPQGLWQRVTSRGYAFFFESMFLMHCNRLRVRQVPIVLPTRVYGESKMSWRDASRSLRQLGSLYWARLRRPGQFVVPRAVPGIDPRLVDPQGWDEYWEKKRHPSGVLYEAIAALYRVQVIRRRLEWAVHKEFPQGSRLLHAGCGSGQVDSNLHQTMRITAVDISVPALEIYLRENPGATVRHASILDLPFAAATFDGVYNLGVMEHFTRDEIARILREFHRVLRPGGKLVLLWPHRFASSVLVLNSAHFLLNEVLRRNIRLHPAEISLLRSKADVGQLLDENDFDLTDYHFGWQDLFVQGVITATRRPAQGARAAA